ncbi:LysM peptidoglycan-binding domain-containing protein [Roseivivax sp. CAU 1753]
MIRVALYISGFLAITAILILMQPGATPSNRIAATAPPAPAAQIPQPAPIAQAPPAPVASGTVSRNDGSFAPTALPPTGAVAPDDMRQLTWTAIARINAATGRNVAPGRPGSLLHAVVQKSLAPTASPASPAAAETGQRQYVVLEGDSLVSIARAIYGDANMTGPLYAANADQLDDPRDLSPGQVLFLPER